MKKYIDEVIAEFEKKFSLPMDLYPSPEMKQNYLNLMAHIKAFLSSALEEQKREILEEIAGKVEKLRNGVLARSGPNDTPHTRLAELSLFQEIKQLLTPLPSSTEE